MNLKKLLPEFPRTQHLPYKPNAVAGDIIAEDSPVFNSNTWVFEGKIDGSSVGMTVIDDHPVIRNRTHILMKVFFKETAAKKQFGSVFNWFYDNKDKFKNLDGYSVYGEWCVALHGIRYDKLPSYFIAYDVYDHDSLDFLDPLIARKMLTEAGFATTPLLHVGNMEWEKLENWTNEPSAFSTTDRREGVYFKIGNGKIMTDRYKMVRADFVQGCHWNPEKITKNKVV